MTTVQLEGIVARTIEQSLSAALAMINAMADTPEVQHLGALLAGFVFLATLGRALGIGR